LTRFILAAAALVASGACTPPASAPRAASSPIPVVRTWPLLGTTLYVGVWDADTARALAAIDSAHAAAARVGDGRAAEALALPVLLTDLLDSLRIERGTLGRGPAIDRGMAALRTAGARRAVIDLGGDFAVLGAAPVVPRWSVGLPNPFHPGEVYAALQVDRGAVSTFAGGDGDNSGGAGRRGELASVSVLAPGAALAAALSRALHAMDLAAGCRLAARYHVQAVWVRSPGDEEDEDRDADDGVDPELVVLTDGLDRRLELLSEEPATERLTRCSEVMRR
jgi:thiamine biosynthesis lipoprotein